MGYYQGDYYMAGGPLTNTFRAALRNPKLRKAGAAMAGKVARIGGRMLRRKLAGGKGRRLMAGAPRRGRRMHATNVRALRRSLTRIKAFERIARRVLTITHGKTPHTRFKLARKKR